MTQHQGALDGLCGPYAIVNAFELLDYRRLDRVFRTACSAIARSRWPEVLWKGTTLRDLKQMITACRKELSNTNYIDVQYPFYQSPAATNNVYWGEFDEQFSHDRTVCCIIGIKKPFDHWIVAGRDGGRVQFWDADPHQPEFRKNRKSLFAGERHRWPNQWLLDRDGLIVFRKLN